jgi:hypothetical protein
MEGCAPGKYTSTLVAVPYRRRNLFAGYDGRVQERKSSELPSFVKRPTGSAHRASFNRNSGSEPPHASRETTPARQR